MSNALSFPTKMGESYIAEINEEFSQQNTPAENSLKDKILVVKLGGSTLENQRMVLRDLIWLQVLGVHPVLVHGGGPSINAWLQALHIPTHFEQGLRVTDQQTLEVVSMVLQGETTDEEHQHNPEEHPALAGIAYHASDVEEAAAIGAQVFDKLQGSYRSLGDHLSTAFQRFRVSIRTKIRGDSLPDQDETANQRNGKENP